MASSRMAGIVANVVATLALAGTCGAAQPPATAPSSLPAGTTDPASPRGYAEASWPQWRGPNRDGKVVSGPKLLDAWPKDGPKLVWKNGQIPGWPDAGTGSIVVAGDKVFVYMGWAKFTPSKVITAEYMNEWGWAPDMPDDLVKKVEAARVSAERNDAKTPAALDAYIKDFLGKLDADQAKKFGPTISNRLKKGGNAFERENDQTWFWISFSLRGGFVILRRRSPRMPAPPLTLDCWGTSRRTGAGR